MRTVFRVLLALTGGLFLLFGLAGLTVAATEGLWAEFAVALLLFFTPGVFMLVVAKRGYLRAPRLEGGEVGKTAGPSKLTVALSIVVFLVMILAAVILLLLLFFMWLFLLPALVLKPEETISTFILPLFALLVADSLGIAVMSRRLGKVMDALARKQEAEALRKIRELDAKMPRKPEVVLLDAGESVQLAGYAYKCEYFRGAAGERRRKLLDLFPRVYLTNRRLIVEGGSEGVTASIPLEKVVGIAVTEEDRPIPALEVTTALSGQWRHFAIKIPEAARWREAIARCRDRLSTGAG